MEKLDEGRIRYKWSNPATNLLVSIWSHDQVQNQLQVSTRNQPIWESIARYMSRRGFTVTGLQCRTRIKNMLCTYHESIRKKDPTIIEPYFEIFKKVVHNKNSKKKEAAKSRKQFKQELSSEDSDDNQAHPESSSMSEMENSNNPDQDYQIEYLDFSSQDEQGPAASGPGLDMAQLEKIINKAVEAQTKTITQILQAQTNTVEKLIVAERERMEMMIASERENRRQLETRLDRLLSRLETTSVPQLTYMGAVIESRQNDGQNI